MTGNMEMQGYDSPRDLQPAGSMPMVMVVLAAIMIGTPSGILLAERNAFPVLEQKIVAGFAGIRGYLPSTAVVESAETETPEVIQTGIRSVAAIYYSSKPDSARMAFDLEAANLVESGTLRRPDRIYFDLKDRGGNKAKSGRMKTQKAVDIGGDLLSGVRVSQRKSGTTRIVLDLTRSCDFTVRTLPGPLSRLLIQIRPQENAAPSLPAS